MAYELPSKTSNNNKPETKALGFLNVNMPTKGGSTRKIAVGVTTVGKPQDEELHTWLTKCTDEQKEARLAYIKEHLVLSYNANEATLDSFLALPEGL